MVRKPLIKNKIIFIVGPTAVGKSEIAAYLARKINGEILCCDSMQIYEGMDILSSKPSCRLRKMAKHHLFSYVPLNKDYSVYSFRKQALKTLKKIVLNNKIPIFVGGTGLYMHILKEGIFDSPRINKSIRKDLYGLAAEKGNRFLYEMLLRIDPEAAKKIHQNDLKRIIRALEVFRATGRKISVLQKERRGLKDDYDIKIFCFDMDRESLYSRIDKRVDSMFRKGLLKEVKKLSNKNLSKTCRYGIGISETFRFLKGDINLKEAKAQIKMNTRHYAKRQLTWFRKDPDINWVKLKNGYSAKDEAIKISVKIKS